MTPPLPPVVGPLWARDHRGDLILADVRWYPDGRDGQAAYRAGHLPGAVWVDLDTVLSGPPDDRAGRHPLPHPAAFARALGDLGIGDDAVVVAYDDHGGAFAARLVWLLRRIGRQAALLDGGLAAWPGRLETGRVTLPPVARRPVAWPPERIRFADAVARAAATGSAAVLDARAPYRHSGSTVPPADARPGHVPGAVHAPWTANLATDGTFAPPRRLRERYRSLGVTAGRDVIVYCGSGVTACHDLLALELIGVDTAALYPGTGSGWPAAQDRPAAGREQPRTGPATGPRPRRARGGPRRA
ncbi:sulfurtransferase [Streptomyces sp. B1866]|uniref:sulfurtransferase n=1 Tax=Streptomyces sp. B1866 TaxID=3075431 RepID=UPI00288CFD7E|nr:sulfurtransferase [Streptomyces sp. B1866]MDT3397732.1 sulfurtransferase [Streptomyces sp. B1866]